MVVRLVSPVHQGSRFALAAMAVAVTMVHAAVATACVPTVAPSTAYAATHAASAGTDMLTAATGRAPSVGTGPDGYHPPY